MTKKPMVALLLALAITAAAIARLDATGGTIVSEDVCVVKSVGPPPSASEGPMRIASVVLRNGAMVEAKAASNRELSPGDSVRVAVRRGVFGGRASYEILPAGDVRNP